VHANATSWRDVVNPGLRAGIAASRQNALDGCDSLYVNSLVRQKHDTNSKGEIART